MILKKTIIVFILCFATFYIPCSFSQPVDVHNTVINLSPVYSNNPVAKEILVATADSQEDNKTKSPKPKKTDEPDNESKTQKKENKNQDTPREITPWDFILIICIIIFAGLFGGVANHFLDIREDKKKISWKESLILGVAAASLVPFFLEIIQSRVLSSLHESTLANLFIFYGYCFLASILSRPFLGTMIERIMKDFEKLKAEVEKQKTQPELDANALHILDQQLSDPENAEVPPKELLEAINKASVSVRTGIFSSARKFRSEWYKKNKKTMERCIPIFRALIAAEGGREYYQTYAQLGFALKDSDPPKYEEARINLTKAIELRNNTRKEIGFTFYEFNRAICDIKIEEKTPADKSKRRGEILNDLRAGNKYPWARENLEKDKEFQNWKERNEVDIEKDIFE